MGGTSAGIRSYCLTVGRTQHKKKKEEVKEKEK